MYPLVYTHTHVYTHTYTHVYRGVYTHVYGGVYTYKCVITLLDIDTTGGVWVNVCGKNRCGPQCLSSVHLSGSREP